MEQGNPELKKYLSSILKATQEGKIEWKNPNPTTFQWIRNVDSGPKYITIQKVLGGPVQDRFVFQIIDVKTSLILMSIDSKEKEDYKPLLRALHQRIEKKVEQKGLDALKEILGDLPLSNSSEGEP